MPRQSCIRIISYHEQEGEEKERAKTCRNGLDLFIRLRQLEQCFNSFYNLLLRRGAPLDVATTFYGCIFR